LEQNSPKHAEKLYNSPNKMQQIKEQSSKNEKTVKKTSLSLQSKLLQKLFIVRNSRNIKSWIRCAETGLRQLQFK